jgi:ferredoxin--NADP+ reductase
LWFAVYQSNLFEMKSWKELNYTIKQVSVNKELAEGAYLISFKRDFDFFAGQVVALGVDSNVAPRLYSIASGESDDLVEILYTEKSGGELTPMLSVLRPGDKLMVSAPFGTFTQVTDDAVYVAAGTGIAPFMSKIKSNKGANPMLIHGVSFPEYFYFADYLQENLERKYIQCCSQYQSDDFFQGRVTQFLKGWEGLNPNKKYYLCGSAEMVVDTRDVLIARGVPFGNINAEIYF